MADLTPKQRRRGLEYANTLAQFASTAPDGASKKAVFGAVRLIREHHGFSLEEKHELIAHALRLGCSTYNDLERETRFHRAHIVDIVKSMADSGLVELRQLQSGEKGGRPTLYIYLIGK